MNRLTRISRTLRLGAQAGLIVALGAGVARADVDVPAEEADPWQAAEAVAEAPSEDRVIGRVAGLRGTVYAQSPGQPRRLLVENAPIYPGDRLITAKGAQLGVLDGEYYTGLSEDTTLTYSKHGTGAPLVGLERGDVRVINAGEGESARITTPGMLAANASGDTRAYAVKEKAWVVSLVCALEGQVEVTGAGVSLVVDEGGCAASKPAEGIFLAGVVPLVVPPVSAAGPPGIAQAASAASSSPVFDDGLPVAGVAAQRFPAPGVGAPAIFAGTAKLSQGLSGDDNSLSLLQPCNSGAQGCGVNLSSLPVVQPTNPWVGGGPDVLP
jgi:hypothetical protein